MNRLNRLAIMAVLLLTGGAACVAQNDNDPFPTVKLNKYEERMIAFGQVRLGGEVLGNGTIVAAYCGNTIRGKGTVKSTAERADIFSFNIGGDDTDEPLHFKVFIPATISAAHHLSGECIIEVDQGDFFNPEEGLGSVNNYYYIDLPAPVVTTTSTEGWATTCLPYNAEVPQSVTIYAATGIEQGELLVQQITGSILPAMTPVLIKTNGKEGLEWLSRVATAEAPATNIFVGTTETTTVEANSVLTLGHSNSTGEIGFWRYTGTTIAPNRAYIAQWPSEARGVTIRIEDGTTGIDLPGSIIPSSEATAHSSAQPVHPMQASYTLDGRRLRDGGFSAGKRGICIKQGRKTIIK